jgi:hypothetical protein
VGVSDGYVRAALGADLEGVQAAQHVAVGTGYADPGAGADAVADADHALRAASGLQVARNTVSNSDGIRGHGGRRRLQDDLGYAAPVGHSSGAVGLADRRRGRRPRIGRRSAGLARTGEGDNDFVLKVLEDLINRQVKFSDAPAQEQGQTLLATIRSAPDRSIRT